MKTVFVSRNTSFDGVQSWTYKGQTVYAGGPIDTVAFRAIDDNYNEYEFTYSGKPKLPANLNDYDLEMEIKMKLIPKKAKEILVEFK